MEKFKKIFKILKAKKLFSKPKKKELFIYDENTFRSGYADFFHENDCFVFETRYKKLYFFSPGESLTKPVVIPDKNSRTTPGNPSNPPTNLFPNDL